MYLLVYVHKRRGAIGITQANILAVLHVRVHQRRRAQGATHVNLPARLYQRRAAQSSTVYMCVFTSEI